MLVIAPTRELAMQISEVTDMAGKKLGLTSVVIYGGMDYKAQVASLKGGVHMLVATPGRLLGMIEGTNGKPDISLKRVTFLVLDEGAWIKRWVGAGSEWNTFVLCKISSVLASTFVVMRDSIIQSTFFLFSSFLLFFIDKFSAIPQPIACWIWVSFMTFVASSVRFPILNDKRSCFPPRGHPRCKPWPKSTWQAIIC
jgi:hypothetical protein